MRTFIRIFWFIASILMIIAGTICFLNPLATLISWAWALGVFVLIDGISTIVYYFGGGKSHAGSGWLLFDGIVSVILGGFVVFSNLYIEVALLLPLLFSIWIIIKGIIAIVHSFKVKKIGWSSWWSLLLIGILVLIFGIIIFIDPIASMFTISALIGFYFIFAGILSLVQWFAFRKLS